MGQACRGPAGPSPRALVGTAGRAHRVAEGAELSVRVGRSLKSIVQAVEQTAAGISRIAASTETQAESAQEVQSAIRSVGRTTEAAAAGSEELAASAEQLGAQASALRDLVSRFRV